MAIRISRLGTEALAEAGAVAGASRLDAEVAAQTHEANGAANARVSRVGVEVLARRPSAVAATRLDGEVAARTHQANAGANVRVSRVAAEALNLPPREASATRLDAEVAGLTHQANAGANVRVSRAVVEVLARLSAIPITPLPLPAGFDFFLHNWATEVEMVSGFLNTISASGTAAESRRGLSDKPLRSISIVWESQDFDKLDRMLVALRRLTDERGPVPIYQDQRFLTAPALAAATSVSLAVANARFFLGQRVAIVSKGQGDLTSQVSFHEILSKGATSLTFSAAIGRDLTTEDFVVPLMDCEVTLEAEIEYEAARTGRIEIELSEVPGASQLPALNTDTPLGGQVFEDAPIFDFEPNWAATVSVGRDRLGRITSQGRGEVVFRAGSRSRETHGFEVADKREVIFPLIEFFDTRRGTLRTFWHIDQHQIFEVLAIDAGGASIDIRRRGTFTDLQAELEVAQVGLVMSDGNYYVRNVTIVQQVASIDRIAVTPNLPAGLQVASVHRCARARRSRFRTDEFTERWLNAGLMEAEVEIIETLEEKDVTT